MGNHYLSLMWGYYRFRAPLLSYVVSCAISFEQVVPPLVSYSVLTCCHFKSTKELTQPFLWLSLTSTISIAPGITISSGSILIVTGLKHPKSYDTVQLYTFNNDNTYGNVQFQNFPMELHGSTGRLVDNIPVLCGGYSKNYIQVILW